MAATPYRSKTLATWVAFLGGSLGLHRFYLHGLKDFWGWLFPLPTLLGVWGIQRVRDFGQDDMTAWLLMPLLGLTVAASMLAAVIYGLTPDEKWAQRFNPGRSDLPASGWGAVIGVIAALMIGAGVLMATIAFSAQRYFEYEQLQRKVAANEQTQAGLA
jgi:hypothetical protein